MKKGSLVLEESMRMWKKSCKQKSPSITREMLMTKVGENIKHVEEVVDVDVGVVKAKKEEEVNKNMIMGITPKIHQVAMEEEDKEERATIKIK